MLGYKVTQDLQKVPPPLPIHAFETVGSETASAKTFNTWTACEEAEWSDVLIGCCLHEPPPPADELDVLDADWMRVDGHQAVASSLFSASAASADETSAMAKKRRTGDKFDWNTLVRKRRKRGGLSAKQATAVIV